MEYDAREDVGAEEASAEPPPDDSACASEEPTCEAPSSSDLVSVDVVLSDSGL